MKQHGQLQFIEGNENEISNLNIPNVLFYCTDTGNYYLYNGTNKIHLNPESTIEGFTGTFVTDTDTITVSNGLITGVEEIGV